MTNEARINEIKERLEQIQVELGYLGEERAGVENKLYNIEEQIHEFEDEKVKLMVVLDTLENSHTF